MGMEYNRVTLKVGSCHVGGGEDISLEELHIIGREESRVATATSPPPALIHHLNVCDDVIRIEGEFITSLWKGS